MKTRITTAIIALSALLIGQALTSCAGLTLTASSPLDAETSWNVTTSIAPRPVVVPAK